MSSQRGLVALAAGILALAVLPARAEAPSEARKRFDVGWDAGPTYEVWQSTAPLRAYDPTGLLADFELRGRIGGSLSLDGGWLDGAVGEGDEGFAGTVRRARLYTSGVFRIARPIEYKFEFAFEEQDVFLNDFYLRWHFSRWIDSIQVGYFDPPVSLEALAGTRDRGLMEVAPALSAFAPGFRIGAQVAGSFERPSLSWAFNISSLGQSPNDAEVSSSPLRLTVRGVWRPWIDEGSAEPTLLHVGLSLRYQIAGSGSVQFRSRPESFLADYAVDTDELEGSFGTVGVELAWRRGPLFAQGEFLRTHVDADEEGSVGLHGLYAQISWAMTGEHRPYDAKRGVFGRIEPAHPFAPRRGQWGALETTARIGWIDLTDGDVRGGRMFTFHVGPAWTWNRHVRLLGGYVFAHVQDRPGSEIAHVLQSRLELWF
jgi:phosphate-selective porin OprO/OprP